MHLLLELQTVEKKEVDLVDKEVEVLVLENNEKYYPLKQIRLNGVLYYVLINVNNAKDICVRKEIEEDGVMLISMLDSEEELRTVLSEYKKLVEN